LLACKLEEILTYPLLKDPEQEAKVCHSWPERNPYPRFWQIIHTWNERSSGWVAE